MCDFISLQSQIAGYLVEIIIPRYLGLVCKISRYFSGVCLHQPEDSHYARALSKMSRVPSFEVEFGADDDAICNFWLISQIRNSGLFGNLELMKTGLECLLLLGGCHVLMGHHTVIILAIVDSLWLVK